MGFQEYEKSLVSPLFDGNLVNEILDQYFHGGISHFCNGDSDLHIRFRRDIANSVQSEFEIKCHPLEVVVCGSAHLGFSPSPTEKLGRPFDVEKSDIDVAVLLPELFDRWWYELLEIRADDVSRRRIADNLLNGLIDPQTVHQDTEIGKKWWRLFGRMTAVGNNKVRGRIYRSAWFMQNYHRQTVVRGRQLLLGRRQSR